MILFVRSGGDGCHGVVVIVVAVMCGDDGDNSDGGRNWKWWWYGCLTGGDMVVVHVVKR